MSIDKEKVVTEISKLQEECLSIYNKIQEAINLERDGKWYIADTKLQGIKQKILNLHSLLGGMDNSKNDQNT